LAFYIKTISRAADWLSVLPLRRLRRLVLKVSFFLAWYDCWIGFFYDQKKKALYFCPLPCVVFKFQKAAE
jgi:hypothetical protein